MKYGSSYIAICYRCFQRLSPVKENGVTVRAQKKKRKKKRAESLTTLAGQSPARVGNCNSPDTREKNNITASVP